MYPNIRKTLLRILSVMSEQHWHAWCHCAREVDDDCMVNFKSTRAARLHAYVPS
eukprot:SAG31_NODE_1252_length_9108_cov_24.066711_6_plen_54_part_00